MKKSNLVYFIVLGLILFMALCVGCVGFRENFYKTSTTTLPSTTTDESCPQCISLLDDTVQTVTESPCVSNLMDDGPTGNISQTCCTGGKLKDMWKVCNNQPSGKGDSWYCKSGKYEIVGYPYPTGLIEITCDKAPTCVANGLTNSNLISACPTPPPN